MKTKTIINKVNKEFKNDYGMAVLNVIPNWNEYGLKNFTVNISSIKDEDFTDFSLNTKVDVDGLIDLLVELRGSHIDKYAVQVYAYYHGDFTLRDNYMMLMDNLDLYKEFNIEFEWG